MTIAGHPRRVAKDFDPNQPRDPNTGKWIRLFHGTTPENAERIRNEGLHNPVGTAGWFTLTDSKEQAETYANGGEVVEFIIPADAVYRRGRKDAVVWPGQPHDVYGVKATAYATRGTLDPKFIARRKISKANILWDGDGVQGAGQPRDRVGRWVGLPGPSSIKQIGAFLTPDGFEVIADKGKTKEKKVLKTKRAANNAVARAIREDVDLYVRNQESTEQERQRIAREKKNKAVRERRARKKQEEYEAQFPQRRAVKPKKITASPRPSRRSNKVTISPVERLDNPGMPTQAQVNSANKWARANLEPSEAKYAELITRLLKNKGITQDPAKRGELARRYKMDAGRLVQIERDVYDHMFPSPTSSRRKAQAKGVVTDIASPNIKEMRKHGGKNPISIGEDDKVLKPDIMFQATKGPHKGKWVRVSQNGTATPMTDTQADKVRVQSKIFWTQQNTRLAGYLEKQRAAYRNRQKALRDAENIPWTEKEWNDAMDFLDSEGIYLHQRTLETLTKKKFNKIRVAVNWAKNHKPDPLDHTDSYWWGFYWNDPTMVTSGMADGEPLVANVPMNIRLTAGSALARMHMDPKLLEGILSLPDISHQEMRGRRPGPKSKTDRDDEDFTPATPESRRDAPEWEEKNVERGIKHERRMRTSYDNYMKKHPKSKLTYAEFVDNYYKNKLRIPGGSKTGIKKSKQPRWEGDGFQPPGQPRDRHGKFSDHGLGAVSRTMGLVEQAMQHHGSTTTRRASSGPTTTGAKKNAFKGGKLVVPVKRLPRSALHVMEDANGRPLQSRKLTPEDALYLRNNGNTAITNQRLKEIWENYNKTGKMPTKAEYDLIVSAGGQKHIDGDTQNIGTKLKSGARAVKSRQEMFTMLRGRWASGSGDRSHRRSSISPEARARADEKKQGAKKQNSAAQAKKRDEVAKLFSYDGKKCICIFCGKPVANNAMSLETGKPKALGGTYEVGNIFPAHKSCNEAQGAKVLRDPKLYYRDTIDDFLKNTPPAVLKKLGLYKQLHRARIADARKRGVKYGNR